MFVFNYRFLVVGALCFRKGDFVFAWANNRKPMHISVCICNERERRANHRTFITFGEINNRNALPVQWLVCAYCVYVSVIAKCHNFRFGYLFTCHTSSIELWYLAQTLHRAYTHTCSHHHIRVGSYFAQIIFLCFHNSWFQIGKNSTR